MSQTSLMELLSLALAAGGHLVRRRGAAGHTARLRRGAGRLRLLAPRRRDADDVG
jgi:hypothetical protein